MHETALMQNLLIIAEKTIKENRVKRVNRVTLSVGKLSNALPSALSFAFDAMTELGPLRGAKLELKEIPVTVRCEVCGQEYEPRIFPYKCPECKSFYYTVTQGENVFIESMDCETFELESGDVN